jgi:pyridinium-3,5-bisthiocarboxylic acid mononucleotide nickel chelatase
MKVLYYDCFAGISGDMNLGALIDLGVDQKYLLQELKKIDIGQYEIKIKRSQRKSITGISFEVIIGSSKTKSKLKANADRSFPEIIRLIENSDLAEPVKITSIKIFNIIARAEAKIHGQKINDVHFHEIGAIDSLVDIVGAAICLDYLQVDKIISYPVQVGGGFVKCSHGILPVPAPATAEILTGIPVKSGAVLQETTTPTGAAILAATASEFTENINFTASKIGYGVGHRDTDVPNVLRVFLGEIAEDLLADGVEQQEAYLVECNIDDMNPEMYEAVMDDLMTKGAQDVFLTPIIMKKSRPAVKLSVICSAAELRVMCDILWLQTTTFGLRISKVTKKMLSRDITKRKTKYGKVSMKNGYLHGKRIKSKPEYEDCRKLAKEKGVTVKEIYDSILPEQ